MANKEQILAAIKMLLPINKSEISEIVSEFIEEVSDGNVSGVDAFITAKKLQSISEDIVSATKQFVDIMGSEERHGCKLTSYLAGVRYDFTGCDHPEWNSYNQTLTETKEEMKGIEKELKSMKTAKTIVDEETGETYRINLPVKKGTPTIKMEWIE